MAFTDVTVTIGIIAVLILVLTALVGYNTKSRRWGLRLIFVLSLAALAVGVGIRAGAITLCFLLLSLSSAYFGGWFFIGHTFSGWRRVGGRASVCALFMGPIAAIPGSCFAHGKWALITLASEGRNLVDVMALAGRAMPGLLLVFSGTAMLAMRAETRQEGATISGGRIQKLLIAVSAVVLTGCMNWYAAGLFSPSQAARQGSPRLLSYILISRPSSAYWTCAPSLSLLEAAALEGQTSTVRMLLDHDAFPEADSCALHCAAENGHTEVARVLLNSGFEANGRCDSFTPLHYAATRPHGNMVRLLLEAGANPNAVNEFGDTPLHLAAHAGQKAVMRQLLAAGADPSVSNNQGEKAVGERLRLSIEDFAPVTPENSTGNENEGSEPPGNDEL